MTDQREIIEAQIADLEIQFFEREFYPILEDAFATALMKRRHSLHKSRRHEGEVIAVIGGSGSGKTTAVDRLLVPYKQQKIGGIDDTCLNVAQMNSPSRASGKDIAIEAISALGYQAADSRSEGSLRLLLRGHLQMRETLILSIDEAQDLVRFQTKNERERVVKLLKSLLVDRVWPIDLLLSGTPTLLQTINDDPQLIRRTTIIEVPRLQPAFDEQDILGIVHAYVSDLPLLRSPDIGELTFAARLIHASDREFGNVVKFTLSAIRLALSKLSVDLSCAHFAQVYQRKTNCPRMSNPFLEDDFERIDVRAWISEREGDQ